MIVITNPFIQQSIFHRITRKCLRQVYAAESEADAKVVHFTSKVWIISDSYIWRERSGIFFVVYQFNHILPQTHFQVLSMKSLAAILVSALALVSPVSPATTHPSLYIHSSGCSTMFNRPGLVPSTRASQSAQKSP